MSGRQEYREFRPVELYDVAAVESWLEERDREGYHLLRFRGLYGIFLSGLLRRSQPLPAPAPVAQREVSAAGDDGCLQRAGVGNMSAPWRGPSTSGAAATRPPWSWTRTRWSEHGVPGILSEKCGAICCGCPRSCWCAWGSVSFPGSGGAGDMPLVDQLEHALPGEDCSGC